MLLLRYPPYVHNAIMRQLDNAIKLHFYGNVLGPLLVVVMSTKQRDKTSFLRKRFMSSTCCCYVDKTTR